MSNIVGISSISHWPTGIGLEKAIKEYDDLIDRANHDKPDIILITEVFLNAAVDFNKIDKNDFAELLPGGGEITKFLSGKAKQYKNYIAASYWRKDRQGRRYNSAVLFNRKGEVSGIYDKVFPTIGEMEEGTTPGKDVVVWNTDFGKIGALICFDFNFRELFGRYKGKGVKLICFLSNFRAGLQVPIVAYDYQMFVATSVPSENSVIVDPLGRTLAESSMYGKIIFLKINLDFEVAHIDCNIERVAAMKKKYKEFVRIDVASPEAVYLIFSQHPRKSVYEMIKEFNVETLDEYLNRARRLREKYLRIVKHI